MMIAFLDVQYSDENSTARAAILLAELWTDGAARWMNVVDVSEVAPYQPGEFFRRELPCLQKALASAPEKPSAIVINGYVWLDQSGRPAASLRNPSISGEPTADLRCQVRVT